jgi:hypothetical protein
MKQREDEGGKGRLERAKKERKKERRKETVESKEEVNKDIKQLIFSG